MEYPGAEDGDFVEDISVCDESVFCARLKLDVELLPSWTKA